MGVIYILWQRQLKRYFRSKARVVGSLAQPVLFLVALGFGLGPIYHQATGGNFIQFLAPGIIAMSVLFTSVFLGIDLIWDKQFGFLKETLVAPVPRIMIMLGRTLGAATVGFLQGILIFVLSLIVGFQPELSALFPLAFLFMFFIALFFTAFGTAIASCLEDMSSFPLIMNFVVMPIFFLSGSLFPLENLPSSIRWFSYINPLTYGVDGLRIALVGGEAFFGLGMDLLISIGAIAIILVIGTQLFRRIQI
jgi:ABC-2 type transport system permease protein